MKPRLAALVLIVFAPLAATAAPPAWTVDKAGSSLRFASSLGGEAFAGSFRRWDADIRFDPADLGHSSVLVTVDVASAVTGGSDRDQALPTPAFFNAAKFPRATYQARSFKALGANHYQAIGTLSIRGVSRPFALPFTLVITGSTAKMSAQAAVNRLAFGVGQDEWKATTTLPAAVQLTVSLNARRAR